LVLRLHGTQASAPEAVRLTLIKTSQRGLRDMEPHHSVPQP
jgi:hypothetical protein